MGSFSRRWLGVVKPLLPQFYCEVCFRSRQGTNAPPSHLGPPVGLPPPLPLIFQSTPTSSISLHPSRHPPRPAGRGPAAARPHPPLREPFVSRRSSSWVAERLRLRSSPRPASSLPGPAPPAASPPFLPATPAPEVPGTHLPPPVRWLPGRAAPATPAVPGGGQVGGHYCCGSRRQIPRRRSGWDRQGLGGGEGEQ